MILDFDTAADLITAQYEQLNEEILARIADHIRVIGDMRLTELHRIDVMLRMGANLDTIKTSLAQQTAKTTKQIEDIILAEAYSGYEHLRAAINGVPPDTEAILHEIITAVATQTQGEVYNLSRTTAFCTSSGVSPIATAYQDAVDKAIYAVQGGYMDFHTAMRQTLTTMADDGVRTVDYKSGYHRKLDTAVRQNVLDGVHQVQQRVQNQLGERLGCDGYELSVHDTCAPDHLPIQGRQFGKAEFENLQSGQDFRDYRGNEYAGIKRPVGQWNCRHIAFAVILGISPPMHDDDELDEVAKRNSEKSKTIDGKKYTPYEATQLQRKLETVIRRSKDREATFRAAGDELAATRARTDTQLLTRQYSSVCEQAGLPPRKERLKGLTGDPRGGKINSQLVNAAGQTIIPVTRVSTHGTPNTITQRTNAKGGIDRNYYGDDSRQTKQVTNNDHGFPKTHPFGEHGEHVHDYVWQDGKLQRGKPRELTDIERKENGDIL